MQNAETTSTCRIEIFIPNVITKTILNTDNQVTHSLPKSVVLVVDPTQFRQVQPLFQLTRTLNYMAFLATQVSLTR